MPFMRLCPAFYLPTKIGTTNTSIIIIKKEMENILFLHDPLTPSLSPEGRGRG